MVFFFLATFLLNDAINENIGLAILHVKTNLKEKKGKDDDDLMLPLLLLSIKEMVSFFTDEALHRTLNETVTR